MPNHLSRLIVALAALSLSQLSAEERAAAAPPAPPPDTLSSWRDDAGLTSVYFIDAQRGWAVGDHGVVLHTVDGGARWTAQQSGVGCRLRSVHFLNAEVGWIVGGYYDPFVHRSRGVLLHTTDGGASWQLEPTPMLAALRKIRMTSSREGWVVGDPSNFSPSGVHFTRDGGRSWSAAGGNVPAGIAAADFKTVQLENGAINHNFRPTGHVADAAGRVVKLDGQVLAATASAEHDLRTARSLKIRFDESAWLVGDGGLVARTADAGLNDGGSAWNAPIEQLATGAGAQCDWRALTSHQSHVWIVGSPGSVVLHSPDDGRTWELLPTGQSLPLEDVWFLDDMRGFAVGALGTILATTDGGRTWKRQSYGDRRAALWCCFADAASLPLELIAKSCNEEGYRTAATILARRDLEPGTQTTIAAFDRTADALSAVGISAAEQSWGFPLRQAALQLPASEVLATWGGGEESAGLLRAQAALVMQLRIWRPDVVLTHAPAPRGDLPTDHLLHQLVMQALELAADPQAFPEQIEILGLSPWQAKKAFGHEPNQSQGTVLVKSSDVLTRTATALDDFCSPSRALLFDRKIAAPTTVAARMCMNRAASGAPERELFAGIVLPAGGDARRSISGVGGDTIAKMRRAAERRRSLEGLVIQKRGNVGVELAGRMRDVTAGLDDAAAGRAVFELAEMFRSAGRWEAARETYEYLLARYPQHSDSEAALHRLVHYLASSEADLRLRRAMVHNAEALTMAPLDAGSLEASAATARARHNASAALGQVEAGQIQTGPFQSGQVQNGGGVPIPGQAGAGGELADLKITFAQGPPTITNDPVMATPAAMLLGRRAQEAQPIEMQPAVAPLAAAERYPVQQASATLPIVDPAALEPALLNPNAVPAGAGLIGYTGDEDRRKRCIALGAYFENRDPVGHGEPTILFPLAAARRRLGQAAEAESFYKHFVRSHPEDAWWACAASEGTLRASAATALKRQHRSLAAAEKPTLDGKLDDAAWRTATPLDLRSPTGDDAGWPATAMIAHDAEYLYLAVRCRRTPNADMPAPTGPRQRDTDLSAHDRVDFCFDLDRDYATYFKLSVDRRGWTAESCWDDKSWDPEWYVASGGDDDSWIVEAAIPWSELTTEPPSPSAVWALGVQRIAPSIGVQSWTAPAGAGTRPETFGHLTFE